LTNLPKPVPGLVIRYSHLWAREAASGKVEGTKDRPCAIILAVETGRGHKVVALPVTHRPPSPDKPAIEIPAETKRRLGLDADISWIVLNEANHFAWPGYDLRPTTPGDLSSVAYGLLPASFFRAVRDAFVAAHRARRTQLTDRSE